MHWLMREGVECQVEMVNGSKGIVVITKSIENRTDNCVSVFNRILSCVMEAKAEFCHSIRPQFFLLDSTDEADYLSEDNLFAISEVERALIHPKGNDVILSVSGRTQMERSRLLCMQSLTQWHTLFSVDFSTILDLLLDIVRDLYRLGLYLGVSQSTLDTIEANFPTDVDKRRRELVRSWMTSSPDPPCWWHLVEALKKIDQRVLAKSIEEEHCKLECICVNCMRLIIYFLVCRCSYQTAREAAGSTVP